MKLAFGEEVVGDQPKVQTLPPEPPDTDPETLPWRVQTNIPEKSQKRRRSGDRKGNSISFQN